MKNKPTVDSTGDALNVLTTSQRATSTKSADTTG
jgi:hypothetical protein